MGTQYLAEGVSFSVHHGLVKAAVESEAGDIDVLFAINTFMAAVRTGTELAKRIDLEHRSRVAPACRMCDRRSGCPPN